MGSDAARRKAEGERRGALKSTSGEVMCEIYKCGQDLLFRHWLQGSWTRVGQSHGLGSHVGDTGHRESRLERGQNCRCGMASDPLTLGLEQDQEWFQVSRWGCKETQCGPYSL